MSTDQPRPDQQPDADRRRLLRYAAAALAGLGGVGLAATALGPRSGPQAGTPPRTPDAPSTRTTAAATPPASTPAVSEPDVGALIERFAPDLHFDRREQWFPTDPRPYATRDGTRSVIDGFDALAGYTRELRAAGVPPRPTVFYHAVPASGTVVALQYWLYSVFDQFTTNFHWHDWELLQVFVDTDTEEARLLVASAHARSCPNNEVWAPEFGPTDRPVVLAELGSHSSATDVNGSRARFERLGIGGLAPDVTNASIVPFDGLPDHPFAYGLPRDEGARLPYALPELDGVPLPDHPRLPDVTLEDFVDQDVTVRGWGDLARPPDGLPIREPGVVLRAPGSEAAGGTPYRLEPIEAVRDTIDDFTGPQLSFEFSIPGFVEDRIAGHITASGAPWDGARFSDPPADITDPAHYRAIAGTAPRGLTDRVVGTVSHLLGRPDGTLDGVSADDREELAPYLPVSRFALPVEVACLLRSDPVAVPTAGGVFRFVHVPPGPHELVINGPGLAPYAERFDHAGGTTRPGVDGRVTLVDNADAVLLRADRRDTTGVRRVRIVETFAGAVFDAAPVEEDRFAIPVHEEGRYVVELVDRDGLRGTVRVDPGELRDGRLPPVETGKRAVLETLAAYLREAAALSRELAGERQTADQRSVADEFDAAAGDASGAAGLAAEGDRDGANVLIERVVDRLYLISRRLQNPDDEGYTTAAASALDHLATQGIDQAEAAYATPLATA